MLRKVGTLVLGLSLLIGLSSFTGNKKTTKENWERLGSKVVNFKLDRDVLAVGAHEGKFTKLKLAVTGGALNMHRIVVHYGNGTKDELEVRHNFSKRSSSRVLDLRGGDRVIKKITFVYDTKNMAKRKAKLHVFGRH